jgi:hypothetical protein
VPQPYGQLEFQVLDPNGYVLVFAQPIDAAGSGSGTSTEG